MGSFAFVCFSLIFTFSFQIAPKNKVIDAPNVIGGSIFHILVIVFSVIFVFIILFTFLHVIFHDQMSEFGISFLSGRNQVLLKILVIFFIVCILVLFDVSLINIYLLLFINTGVWWVGSNFSLNTIISGDTNLIAYSSIGALYFGLCFLILMVVTVGTSFAIVSESGMQRINKVLPQPSKWGNIGYGIFFGILIVLFSALSIYSFLVFRIPLIMVFIFGGGIIFSLVMLIGLLLWNARIWNVLSFLQKMFIRFSMLFLAFYILPILIWGFWDSMVVFTGGNISRTIYRMYPLSSGLQEDFWSLLYNSLWLNSISFLRILELDFALIIGMGGILLGLAEGFTILALYRGIRQGREIRRDGEIVDKRMKSSKRIRLWRSIFLGVWSFTFWSKIVWIFRAMSDENLLSLDLTFIPTSFALLFNAVHSVEEVIGLPVSLFVFPIFIVADSSIRFFSVSIIAKRRVKDLKSYFFFIVATFVLIIINAYAEISLIEILQPPFDILIPFSSSFAAGQLNFIVRVFTTLEAIFFIVGALFVIYYLLFIEKREK